MNLYKKTSPPKADIIPHYHLEHGNERVDNYYWLKDIKNPKVIDYLKKETRYYDQSSKNIVLFHIFLLDTGILLVMKLGKNILFIPEKRKLLIQKKKSYSIAMIWPKIMNTST